MLRPRGALTQLSCPRRVRQADRGTQSGTLCRVRWWLLSREEAGLSREEALRVAREHVEAQGLPWTEPVKVWRGPPGCWRVVTNADNCGGNIFMEVTVRGQVKGGTGVTPR
jgi:hypothetical protein